MVSKRLHVVVPVLATFLLLAPLVVPNVFGASYTLKPTPARAFETSMGSAYAVDLVLNVSQASTGTTYQFTWVVTDPSGAMRNHQNSTVAPASSFLINLYYPRDFGFGGGMILAGNYTVVINQSQPTMLNSVATGQFQVGLTDKLVYKRTDTVLVSAAGYGNGEAVTMNFTRGSTTYSSVVNANSAGQVSGSWQIPLNAPVGVWTVLLNGAMTSKSVVDRQAFTIIPLNVTLSQLTASPSTVQRTMLESISFTSSYQTGPIVQTGSARVRLTEADGITSFFTMALYNSSLAAFRVTYTIPAGSQTGTWIAAVDSGMFNDSYGNTGPTTSVTKQFTVWPTNVTISQLSLTQLTLQRTQTESLSFAANYLNGVKVQTGSATVRLVETDGSTSIPATATYNSGTGLFQASTRIPPGAQVGAWIVSVDPSGFNDGYGNGGPPSSVVRALNVQSANLTVIITVSNQTYTVGQVVPIYAVITYPDGTPFTTGAATVSFTAAGNQTGKPVALTYVQGQSRWAGSYIVGSRDMSGVWVATLLATDQYGNYGQQTTSLVVSVPTQGQGSNQEPISLYWFLLAAIIIGSGGSGLLLLRRSNLAEQPFDELFNLMGGELPPSSTILILGDAGSGTSTLGLQLIQRQLSAGKSAGLIAYDAFPQEIQRNMRSFGWEMPGDLKGAHFKILDCYSALAGIENSIIRDPVDFTEISIRVSQMMEDAGGGPYLLVLDSLSPIFNGVKPETTINFLRVLGAKIKSSSGTLLLLGSKGGIPQQARPSVENIVDGVIELDMVRSGNKTLRLLTVKRLAGRKISPVPAEFEIITGKGIVFRKPRIPLKILTPKREASQL